MLNSPATQTAASGEAKQSHRKQEHLTKPLKASETDYSEPALFFQTAILYSWKFSAPGQGAQHYYPACGWQPAEGRKYPKGFLFS